MRCPRKLTVNERMKLKLEQIFPEIYLRTGLNQEDVAHALGVSKTTLWRKKNAPQDMTLTELRRISELAGKNFSEFIADFVK